jgi:hypothetical protein
MIKFWMRLGETENGGETWDDLDRLGVAAGTFNPIAHVFGEEDRLIKIGLGGEDHLGEPRRELAAVLGRARLDKNRSPLR